MRESKVFLLLFRQKKKHLLFLKKKKQKNFMSCSCTRMRHPVSDRRLLMNDTSETSPDLSARLKTALRGMPGPVALVTTSDPATGQPAGLAASAVIPMCMAPPSMIVCVNRSASAHAVIEASGRFCINLVGAAQTGLVAAFASSAQRDRRFATGQWAERHGLPHLPASPASIFCTVRTTLLFGTHEVFVGEAFDLICNAAEAPIGWIDGAFARYAAMDGHHPVSVSTGPLQSADRSGASS